MRRIMLCLIISYQFLTLNSFAQAPNWLWAKAMGGASFSNDVGTSIATDASANIYTAGDFAGTVDFNPGTGTFNLTSAGQDDIFISKLNSSGNFIWAKRMGGTNSEYVYCIALDASGNVYTTGSFSGTVDFDPGSGTYNLTSAGVDDIFISKLDSSGNFAWAKRMGGTSNESAYSLALDAFGNVYTAGSFWGTADFDPGAGTFNLTSAGGDDIFISKLDSAGNFIWAKVIGGTGYNYCYAITINPLVSADIYITGSFTGTADFDPGMGVFNLTSAGNNDIYICKLDSTGNFIWAIAMGSSMNNDYGFSITVDPAGSGDVYTKGSFQGTVDFDPGAGVFNLTGAGGFISKLNSSGNFIWAIALGGGSGLGRSLALDASGNVYASGAFTGTTDFDPGPGTFNLTSAGFGDAYISKYNSAGNFAWVKTAGGQYNDACHAIAFDASGQVHLTGLFSSPTITFSPTTLTNVGSSGVYSDIFIVRTGSSNPLPIELISFDGISNGSEIDLMWATASEINNDYFTVERSKDAQQFEQAGIVDGAGNSAQLLNYFFIDEYPIKGVSYYRLKQTDFDGTHMYSNTIAINFEYNNIFSVNISQNPVTEQLTIALGGDTKKVVVTIAGITGKIIYSTVTGETKKIEVSTKDFAAGIYFLRLETDNNVRLEKISVIK